MHQYSPRRPSTPERTYDPAILADLPAARNLWHETETEIHSALAEGCEKARLLRWVRREMGRRLSPRERRFLDLHYFSGLEQVEIARRNGIHKATVSRTLRRAVEKLRRAARENEKNNPRCRQ